MGLLTQATDFTDKDFDSLRLRLQSLVRSVFPVWTDFHVANFGNILLELYAFVGDVLTFYQDNRARESRLLTATQRKNLIALTKLLGFRPAGARAATTEEVFTLATTPAADVRLPQGTRVRTASVTEPAIFQLLGDVVIPAGAFPSTLSSITFAVVMSQNLAGTPVALAVTPTGTGAGFTAASFSFTQFYARVIAS